MKESTERAREIAAASRKIRRTDKIPHPFSDLLYYMWGKKNVELDIFKIKMTTGGSLRSFRLCKRGILPEFC